MRIFRHLGLIGFFVVASGVGHIALAQTEKLTLKRPAELREGPAETTRSLATLAVPSELIRLAARQGPWIEVRTAQGVTGWIHMFDVGSAPPAQGGNVATGAMRGLTSFLTRSPTQTTARTSTTSTIGIRGLGAEDIANAQPNLAAVAQAEGMRVDGAQARSFGESAELTIHPVAALPVPPPPKAPGSK